MSACLLLHYFLWRKYKHRIKGHKYQYELSCTNNNQPQLAHH